MVGCSSVLPTNHPLSESVGNQQVVKSWSRHPAWVYWCESRGRGACALLRQGRGSFANGRYPRCSARHGGAKFHQCTSAALDFIAVVIAETSGRTCASTRPNLLLRTTVERSKYVQITSNLILDPPRHQKPPFWIQCDGLFFSLVFNWASWLHPFFVYLFSFRTKNKITKTIQPDNGSVIDLPQRVWKWYERERGREKRLFDFCQTTFDEQIVTVWRHRYHVSRQWFFWKNNFGKVQFETWLFERRNVAKDLTFWVRNSGWSN